jgi:dienelactone hydrolase
VGARVGRVGTAFLILCAAAVPAAAQIGTDLVERRRADLQQQAADPAMKREGGTIPQDWNYALPDGVTTRQVTFFVDGGTPLHGKIFYPKDFTSAGPHAAVVVGHGINALSIGIEKYAARFAERGLVAMAIDYRTYGFSGSDLRLLEPDPTRDDDRFPVDRRYRVETKRTNLNNFREVEDFRAAVSYLQGEPGVDPRRIGLWGSSNGGAVVVMTAAVDARVKAVVSQVGAVAGIGAKGPVPMRPEHVEDAIQRARTGQGAEADGGFSFRSKIDLWGTIVNREFRPGAMLDRVPLSTRILWLPAEKDELIPLAGPLNAPKSFNGTSQAIVLPHITHFQAYSGAAFDVGSSLAADWFLKYLVTDAPTAGPAPPPRQVPYSVADSVERRLQEDNAWAGGSIVDSRAIAPPPAPLPDGVSARAVTFFSELVQCYAKLYLPKDFSPDGSWPAVVLAPGWEQTAGSVDRAAADLAWRGIVAMASDYRRLGRQRRVSLSDDDAARRRSAALRAAHHDAAHRAAPAGSGSSGARHPQRHFVAAGRGRRRSRADWRMGHGSIGRPCDHGRGHGRAGGGGRGRVADHSRPRRAGDGVRGPGADAPRSDRLRPADPRHGVPSGTPDRIGTGPGAVPAVPVAGPCPENDGDSVRGGKGQRRCAGRREAAGRPDAHRGE